MEVDSGTRKKLIQDRIKLGWAICRVDDYIAAKGAFVAADITTPFGTARGGDMSTVHWESQTKRLHSRQININA